MRLTFGCGASLSGSPAFVLRVAVTVIFPSIEKNGDEKETAIDQTAERQKKIDGFLAENTKNWRDVGANLPVENALAETLERPSLKIIVIF